jgi:hypothetical protein
VATSAIWKATLRPWLMTLAPQPPARARANNLTPGTDRLAADNPTIVAQFCVQPRKIAIRITMTAITAMPVFVSVTNVRYMCS